VDGKPSYKQLPLMPIFPQIFNSPGGETVDRMQKWDGPLSPR